LFGEIFTFSYSGNNIRGQFLRSDASYSWLELAEWNATVFGLLKQVELMEFAGPNALTYTRAFQ